MGIAPFTILVVDDDATVRRSLADILRLEGYPVQKASSGEEAIQILKDQPFDLIFLDLKMTGIGGLDVMRFAHENAPDSQIILLTAHGSLESAIEALRIGAQDYLLKPVSPEQIIASTSKAVRNRQDRKNRANLLSQIEASLQALKDAQDPNREKPISRSGVPVGNGIMVDYDRRVLWKDELLIELTPMENELLKIFLSNPQFVFTYQELVRKVHGYHMTNREAAAILRPLISRLRGKLQNFPGAESWITSIRSNGYVFDQTK